MWILVDYDDRIISYCSDNMDGNTGWQYYDGKVPFNCTDYRMIDGQLVYDPLPEPVMPEPEVSADVAEILAIIGGEV